MNLQEMIAARAAKLADMKALNEANPTMDETVQASYDALHAEFTKLNRDVEIAKTYAKLEEELLEEINKLGIGPSGFGGKVTALDVKIEWYPCHIASLPVAVNIQCHASRHKEIEL